MTDTSLPAPRNVATPALRALHSPASWLRFLIPALLGLALDLVVKAYAFPAGVASTSPSDLVPEGRHPAALFDPITQHWATQDPVPLIPNVLGFVTTVNHGAVFGLGQGKVPLFLAFSFLALGVILWTFITSTARQRLVHLALGLITAGALGNMYDRAVLGGVRDMLRFTATWYPYIFNIADVLLCVGVPLLIARWLFIKDDPIVPSTSGSKPQPSVPS